MLGRHVFTVVYWHTPTEGARVYETLGWLGLVFMGWAFSAHQITIVDYVVSA